MDRVDAGWVPAVLAVVVVVGQLVYVLACAVSAAEPRTAADTRRRARALRWTPWLVAVSAAVVAVTLVLRW
ncbi:hypothetical protein GCM10010492_17060 [Saccharothrix mutabilis subsp. mutabilis]|uniref:Uncharacterized protein n=1 Tax=Saccharothrix mutabilis subsp. mutabilis TaxID=66855 RepID=A0ABN0TEG8_9PSEU